MSWHYEIKALAEPRKAEVAIFGDIGESWFEETVTAKQFVGDFAAIDADEIIVRINSHGGSVVDGLAIYNAIKRHPAATISSVEGVAASIASYIAMACDQRMIAENALFMVHGAWTLAAGNSTKLREVANVLDLHSAAMSSGYAAATGKSIEDVRALLTDGADHWYSAKEAYDEGYFDTVTTSVEAFASFTPGTSAHYAPAAVLAAIAAPTTKGNKMEKTPAPAVSVAAAAATINHPDEATISAAAVKAETQRRTDIQSSFKPFATRDGVADIQAACENNPAVDVKAANQQLLAHLGSQGQPISGASITTVQDETDKRNQGIVASLLIRAGVADAETRKIHAANPWRGNSLLDVARGALARGGIKTDGMDKMQIVGMAFTQSTSDFPVLLETVLHKTLQQAYASSPDTWPRFAAVGSVSDFRAHKRYRVGSIGNLDTVNELGEFKTKAIPDAESASVIATTRGNIINVSRQAIVNDDIGAFTGLAVSLGRAARRTVEASVYARLAENSGAGPTMSDGVVMFHATHANLVATGAAPTVAQFDSMRVLMSQQKDVGGNDFLDLRPAIWLGPVGLGGAARVVNESEYDPDAANKLQRANAVRGLVGDIVDTPRLSGTAYYMFADPNSAPAFEVAFLDGNDAPFLEVQNGFTVDGVAWKVRLDFGVAAIDYRGAVKNNGA